jgi:ornithine cyclodeaminase
VRIAGRTTERAEEFVAGLGGRFPFTIVAAPSVEAAVRDADIVVTATSSREPILERSWLAPGTHVNAVGASQRTHRELDVATVVDSLLFTDRRQSLENEAAEYHLAVEDGLISASHLRGELGELVTGKVQGRTSEEELTLFRSLGLAVFDLAAAERIVAKAHESGTGHSVEF